MGEAGPSDVQPMTPEPTTLPIMPGPVPPEGLEAPPVVLTVPKEVLVVVTRTQPDPTSVELVVHHTQSVVINGQAIAPA